MTQHNINSDIYLKDCIKNILISFIKNNSALFSPDMVTCYYGQTVTKFLWEKNIDFLERENNSPNVPQKSLIERLLAICKLEYAKQKKIPQSLNQFRIIWAKIMKKFKRTVAKN